MLPRPAPQPEPAPAPPSQEPEITIEYYNLKVIKSGEGNGLIKSEPGGIFCGENAYKCEYSYPEGTTIKLFAQPDEKSKFLEWKGDCGECGISALCQIVIRKDTICEVTFGKNEAPVIEQFSVFPQTGFSPLKVIFTWVINDIENDSLTCKLDVNGDGVYEYTITNCQYKSFQEHVYSYPGVYNAILEVEDEVGNVSKKLLSSIEVKKARNEIEESSNGGCNLFSDLGLTFLVLAFIFVKKFIYRK